MKLNAQWVTGFVDGEGCFHVGITRHKDMFAGYQVLPEFTVVQHKRDIALLYALKEYFGTGVVRTNHGDRMAYRVRNKKHLMEIVVPFFVKHPLQSCKKLEFEYFSRVLIMMSKQEHLTLTGLEKIRKISKQMNRGRLR